MHDHGRRLSEDAVDSEADDCPYIMVDLACGCQDVYYDCGYVSREHDIVVCDGQPCPLGEGVVELTREQGRAMLDRRTRLLMGLSLDEFEAAYDRGLLDPEAPHVGYLVMLLPFARDVPAE